MNEICSIFRVHFVYAARQWETTQNDILKCHSIKGCIDSSARIFHHYNDVIMGVMVSKITSLSIVYSTIYSGADQRKHQSSASLAFVGGIHRWPVNSPHKWPVMRKMFPFDDVIMMRTRSILWMLMPWLFITPSHQKPRYWLNWIDRPLSFMSGFNCLHYLSVEKWWKMQT